MGSFDSTSTRRVIASFRTERLAGSSPFAQGVVLLSGVVLAIVLLPLLLIAAVVGLAVIGVLGVRRWLGFQRRPNGMLDGRKNVRVRLPGADGGAAQGG